jgi:asparagine synthase (glutamine-hydrolysing)
MCGIAGAFALHGMLEPHHQQVVQRINQWQAHRGPDGERFWGSSDRKVMFGHRRLAIIDTGASGAQPMTDTTGRWTVNLNGEIYNYRELKAELEEAGRVFATKSDTEVLINAIAQWGEHALTRMRGMFAFALWDNQEKELWLARDPYGIKPLYLAEAGNALWFASQARALAECAPVSARRDPAALVGFYVWGSVPEPFSWWADIRPVPAGHVLRTISEVKLPKPKQYYSVSAQFAAGPKKPMSRSMLRETLADSVRNHLVADTDVGVFLSSGVDSNVLASLARPEVKGLKTITLAFREYEGTHNDEAPLAEVAAKKIGSDHRTVRIDKQEFEELLPDFFRKMDQPTIDGLNTYLISQVAKREGLKVVLSGLGGDELFGSYPSFQQIPPLMNIAKAVPGLVTFGRVLRAVSREIFPQFYYSKLASVLACSGNVLDAYMLRRCVYQPDGLDLILDERWLEEGNARLREAGYQEEILRPLQHASWRAQISALESCTYLRNQLLRDADWAGMAHGVEIRVPYVDRVVLETLGPTIASSHPLQKTDLLAVPDALPSELQGRKKTGFLSPAYEWATGETHATRQGLKTWTNLVPRLMRAPRRPAAKPAKPAYPRSAA